MPGHMAQPLGVAVIRAGIAQHDDAVGGFRDGATYAPTRETVQHETVARPAAARSRAFRPRVRLWAIAAHRNLPLEHSLPGNITKSRQAPRRIMTSTGSRAGTRTVGVMAGYISERRGSPGRNRRRLAMRAVCPAQIARLRRRVWHAVGRRHKSLLPPPTRGPVSRRRTGGPQDLTMHCRCAGLPAALCPEGYVTEDRLSDKGFHKVNAVSQAIGSHPEATPELPGRPRHALRGRRPNWSNRPLSP